MTDGEQAPPPPTLGPASVPPSPPGWRPRLPWDPGTTIAVAAIAVVLLLLAGLLLAGSSGGGGPPSTTGGVTYVSAVSTGRQAGSLHGSWELVNTFGLDLANATTVPLNFSTLGNCTFTSFSGALPTSLTIPAFAGSLTSGALAEWLFTYRSPGTGAELAVAVTAGVANLVVEISGAGCPGLGSNITPVPSNVVDSPTAVAALDAAGGSTFLAAHPKGVSLLATLFPFTLGSSAVSVYWQLSYTTCPVLFSSGPPSGHPGVIFSASVNGTTGLVVPGSAHTGVCGGPGTTPIGSALGLGFPTTIVGAGTGGTIASQGCTSGDYCYSIPIVMTADNVTPGDFQIQVTGHNGTLIPTAGYAVLTITGQVLVYSLGPVETAWSSGSGGANTSLSSTMTLLIDVGATNPAGAGYSLTLTGTGPFANSSEGTSLP